MGNALAKVNHEILGCFEKTLDQHPCDLELPRAIVQSGRRMEVLMEHPATFSPVITIAHEHKMPIAADSVLPVRGRITQSRADVQFIQHRHTGPGVCTVRAVDDIYTQSAYLSEYSDDRFSNSSWAASAEFTTMTGVPARLR